MKITATTTFLHDRDRYEEGKEYDLEPALAGYFVGNGWAEGPKASKAVWPDQEVTLDIQSSSHNQKASEVKRG